MKRKLPYMLLVCSLLLFPGCRRTDVKEFTVSIPGLTEANRSQVVEALARYDGIDKSSYAWDFAKKTLTMKYDTMKVAQTNIRMAIAAKGIEVAYPPQTSGVAGYVDTSFGR